MQIGQAAQWIEGQLQDLVDEEHARSNTVEIDRDGIKSIVGSDVGAGSATSSDSDAGSATGTIDVSDSDDIGSVNVGVGNNASIDYDGTGFRISCDPHSLAR
ncbi:hypothetical protein FRX31_018733 [Thalictrum thalictroides]|uniref:Uncharacterized protein n=1 Tax=Thalictrum thalictroides TaxID=46969 RepID=A0A7J6W570_THATH|nr:hypothetical protein FRX31_018733 [Thalictrum thalictroides]